MSLKVIVFAYIGNLVSSQIIHSNLNSFPKNHKNSPYVPINHSTANVFDNQRDLFHQNDSKNKNSFHHNPIQMDIFNPVQPHPMVSSIKIDDVPLTNQVDLKNLDYYTTLGGQVSPLVKQHEDKYYLNVGNMESPTFFNKFAPTQEDTLTKSTRFYPLQQNNFSPLGHYMPSSLSENLNFKPTVSTIQPLKKPRKKLKMYRLYPKKHQGKLMKSKITVKPTPTFDMSSLKAIKNKRKIPYAETEPIETPFTEDTFNHIGRQEENSDFSFPENQGTGHRVQFQMFGMEGPHSYKFGYDTGKGHNRHFRFEERDNHGRVRGHYGHYDQEGKMSMMHYVADPHTGYHVGPYQHPGNNVGDEDE